MKGTVQVKKMRSGKEYLVISLSYVDPDTSKRKQKVVSTGLEARGNKRKAQSMIPDLIKKYSFLELPHTSTISRDITLCEYLDVWLEQKKIVIKQSTYEAYAYRVKSMQAYFKKENLKLVDVTPRMLKTFFEYSLVYGKVNQKTHKREPLAVRSVRSYRSILFAVFNDAIVDGLITVNPLISVSVQGKKNKDYSEEYLFLSEEEIKEFLKFIAEKYPKLLGITFMGIYYGLRRSEILGLKWSAINWEEETITIEHTVVRVRNVTREDDTKTKAGYRTLNLFSAAKKCLLSIKQEQEENARFFGRGYQNKDGYVFTWEDGRPYDPNYISREFKKASTAFGRPEITLHKLRHTCCSLLINKKWPIKQVQYWMGHDDIQTTLNIYAHYNRKMLNESVNDLEDISADAMKLFSDVSSF